LAYYIAYDTLLATVARRDRLDAAITGMATVFTPVVTRLGCLRGVSTLTAFGLAVEIGDWQRLTGARSVPISGWCPPSPPLGRPGRRGRSPRPGTLTLAGC
jgi:transposase